MELKDLQHKLSKNVGVYNYEGIPIFSTDGIHETVFDSFSKLQLAKDCSILVLGAGAGAFDKRLLSNGYTNITTTELIPENYLVKGTKLVEFDLNKDFSSLGKFDCIIALEIIEHLENQFHFIRCVKACLKDGGVFYLSTPNVENTFSRAKFYMLGTLHFFGEGELHGTGHISPIFNHILKFNLQQSDLVISKHFTNGNVWTRLFRTFTLITPLYFVFFLLSFFTKHKNNFDINLYKIVPKKNS
jgi:2-polyprenyl-3-methyl-5-hydroxy-6-metoxy-1,4-benzoquinol methylase